MESVKFYANELMSYGKVYCYLIDVMIGVLLWRGRARVGSWSIWFPIHSVALLTAAVVAMEVPKLVPAVFFFGIAYVMLTINYHGSRYPYPWNRCKVRRTIECVLILRDTRIMLKILSLVRNMRSLGMKQTSFSCWVAVCIRRFTLNPIRVSRKHGLWKISIRSRATEWLDSFGTPRLSV